MASDQGKQGSPVPAVPTLRENPNSRKKFEIYRDPGTAGTETSVSPAQAAILTDPAPSVTPPMTPPPPDPSPQPWVPAAPGDGVAGRVIDSSDSSSPPRGDRGDRGDVSALTCGSTTAMRSGDDTATGEQARSTPGESREEMSSISSISSISSTPEGRTAPKPEVRVCGFGGFPPRRSHPRSTCFLSGPTLKTCVFPLAWGERNPLNPQTHTPPRPWCPDARGPA